MTLINMAKNEKNILTAEEYKAALQVRRLELIKRDFPSLDNEVIEKLYAKYKEILKALCVFPVKLTKADEELLFKGFKKVHIKASDLPEMTKEQAYRQAESEIKGLCNSALYFVYKTIVRVYSGMSITDIAKEFNTCEKHIFLILKTYDAL